MSLVFATVSGVQEWKLYVVRCADDSLYAGVAKDVEKRVAEHNEGKRGAKYTRTRRPVTLLAFWRYNSKSDALKAEHRFKRLSRAAKLSCVRQPETWPAMDT